VRPACAVSAPFELHPIPARSRPREFPATLCFGEASAVREWRAHSPFEVRAIGLRPPLAHVVPTHARRCNCGDFNRRIGQGVPKTGTQASGFRVDRAPALLAGYGSFFEQAVSWPKGRRWRRSRVAWQSRILCPAILGATRAPEVARQRRSPPPNHRNDSRRTGGSDGRPAERRGPALDAG
jgi:hypothetical protein